MKIKSLYVAVFGVAIFTFMGAYWVSQPFGLYRNLALFSSGISAVIFASLSLLLMFLEDELEVKKG